MASAAGDTTGALLAHDKIDRYRPLGAFGKPAYQSHVQLRAMLLARRGPKFANYFARPNYDADTGELRWTAEVPGEARGWHAMSPDEQAQRALDLEVIRSGLASFAQELRAQGGDATGGSQAFASLLEQALKVPAPGEFLYFVGEQPVIAFWGFETPTGGSVDAGAMAPQFAARARTDEIVTSPAAVHTQSQTQTQTRAAPAAALALSTTPWWRWLLWALAALLLLLFLLWLLRACTTDPAIEDGAPFADKPLPDRSIRGANPQGLGEAPGVREGGLGGDVPGGSGAPGMAVPGDPAQGEAPGSPETIPPLKEGEPKPEGNGTPGPDAVADRGDSKSITDPPIGAEPGQPLDLPPEDAKSKGKGAGMGFLAGRWKAGEGLADRATNQPLDLSLGFDQAGKGEVTLRRPDGTTCKGPVEGVMEGGKLSIQGSQSIPCSDGGSYAAPRIECAKDRAGQTQCFGVNNDGSRYYMGMQRQP